MDWVSPLLSALLFVAFVPGVFLTLPSRGASRNTVLLVHAVLFTIVTSVVMRFYWFNIRGYVETMTNFGDSCPNGYVFAKDPTGKNTAECIPAGHATYPASSAPKSKTE
jgi:membrane-associated PAP2 superfamily phosphatase